MQKEKLENEITRLCNLQKGDLCKEEVVQDLKGRYELPKVVTLTQAILKTIEKEHVIVNRTEVSTIPLLKSGGKIDTTKPILQGQRKDRSEYLQNVKIGQIIAYKVSDEIAKSGKVVNISFSRKRLKIMSLKGKETNINFEDVLWVKTAARWPKGIFQMLINNNRKEGA